MKINAFLVGLGIAVAALGGCSSNSNPPEPTTSTAARDSVPTQPAIPTVTGSSPSVVVQVDCGQDGVANVHVDFGLASQDVLVGRNPTTHLVHGVDTFSSSFGLGNDHDGILTVTTRPTTGTCTTTLTDYDSGNVIGQRSTAGMAELKVNLTK
jgi:hypothetical protein